MGKILLSLVSRVFVSRLYGRLARMRRPRFLVRFVIRRYAAHYRVAMDEYQGELEDYASLSDFFIRRLNPGVRPLKADPGCFLSPADGVLVGLQGIETDRAVPVKGWPYKVSELVGAAEAWQDGWWLATIYLSPANYHRYHYPLDGRLESLRHLGGRLYPVNPMGVRTIKGLFVKNERVVASFASGAHGYHIVAVGATFVGSVKMEAHPAPFAPGEEVACGVPVAQLEEMGRFEMGSTLVMLLPKGMADPVMEPGTTVSVGDSIFKLR